MTSTTDTRSLLPRQRAAAPPAPAGIAPILDESTLSPRPCEQRWSDRRAAAWLIRILVLAVPILTASACAAVLSAALPRVHGIGPALLWWSAVLGCSTLVLVVVDRLARRLLPLAVLLRLTLLFPDRAPNRYRMAARAGSTRQLRARLEDARTVGTDREPAEAAARIIALVAMLSAHDRRTRGHSERVRIFNDLIAEQLGLSEPDRDRLRWAALIHDIGKLSVPRRLLNKPSEPTAREWTVLRAHPLRGAQIARPLAAWLGPWAAAVEEHHERWDGNGYPHGRAGTEISLGARIVAVADAFEVMTSARAYGRPVSPQSARAELAACAGSQFDPMVVRAFLNISIGRLRKAMGPIAWLTQIPFLASMPRLEAAIIEGGRQAVVGAGAGASAAALTVGTLPTGGHAHPHVHEAAAVVPVSHHATAAEGVATAAYDGSRAQAVHDDDTPHGTQRAAAAAPARRTRARTRNAATAPSVAGTRQPTPTRRPVAVDDPTAGTGATAATTAPPASRAGGHHGDGNHGRGLGNGGSVWPQWQVRLEEHTPPGTATSLSHDPHPSG